VSLLEDGCVAYPATKASRAWASAALARARDITADPDTKRVNLRHGETWFVGVDALPNDATGAIDGVPLSGAWDADVPRDFHMHPAQVSVMYPGYPTKDTDQSEANHRYRVDRCAAHVDGLLPEGPARRRYPREFHAYVLGIHLNDCDAAPTVYWRGSHRIMGAALRAVIGAQDPREVDVTDAYKAARREVFETCEMLTVTGAPGAAFLMHRHVLHGTAPWSDDVSGEARFSAFFRPEFTDPSEWLAAD
jgi:hypothetical protein